MCVVISCVYLLVWWYDSVLVLWPREKRGYLHTCTWWSLTGLWDTALFGTIFSRVYSTHACLHVRLFALSKIHSCRWRSRTTWPWSTPSLTRYILENFKSEAFECRIKPSQLTLFQLPFGIFSRFFFYQSIYLSNFFFLFFFHLRRLKSVWRTRPKSMSRNWKTATTKPWPTPVCSVS